MTDYPLVIAHRGGVDWAPENTLAAFKKSVESKVGGVEFDVHRCSSGELVIIHDDDLKRTTNGSGLVKDRSYNELKELSCGLWIAEEFKNERVPLLTEALDLFTHDMLVNIELKNSPMGYEGIEKDLLSVIAPYRKKLNILVSSFDHHCLRRLRKLDQDIQIGILAAASLVDLKEYADKFNATYYIQDHDCLMPDAVIEAKQAGLKVIVWSANDRQKWRRLIELGVDGICTDSPGILQMFYGQLEYSKNKSEAETPAPVQSKKLNSLQTRNNKKPPVFFS